MNRNPSASADQAEARAADQASGVQGEAQVEEVLDRVEAGRALDRARDRGVGGDFVGGLEEVPTPRRGHDLMAFSRSSTSPTPRNAGIAGWIDTPSIGLVHTAILVLSQNFTHRGPTWWQFWQTHTMERRSDVATRPYQENADATPDRSAGECGNL